MQEVERLWGRKKQHSKEGVAACSMPLQQQEQGGPRRQSHPSACVMLILGARGRGQLLASASIPVSGKCTCTGHPEENCRGGFTFVGSWCRAATFILQVCVFECFCPASMGRRMPPTSFLSHVRPRPHCKALKAGKGVQI